MEGALLTSRSQQGKNTVSLAAGRDRAAFTALVATYQPDLLRVCYVILGDVTLSEDATQTAWMKAWRKLDQLRDPSKVRSWLLAVAANEARQIARRRRPTSQIVSERQYAHDVDPQLADLAAVLAMLKPDERRLIGLRYVAELTSDQIGAALGVSPGAVRHRLVRLVARIKSELDR
jgi:RNA polymerase sigma-70 factor (ECF subfamily)